MYIPFVKILLIHLGTYTLVVKLVFSMILYLRLKYSNRYILKLIWLNIFI